MTGCFVHVNVGGGFSQIQIPFRGLAWNDGKLYAVSAKKFIEIDPTTGDRLVLSNASSGGVGSGTDPGSNYTVYDKHRDVFWTIGGSDVAVVIEPDSGDRSSLPCWHPGLGIRGGLCSTTGYINAGPLDDGGFVVDPDDPRYVYFVWDKVAILKYDTQTASSVILSL